MPELTPQEHAMITEDYATFGANPRKELVGKRKKAVDQIEMAQTSIARMGAIYEEFGEGQHSEYLKNLYSILETAKILLQEFAGDQ